METAPTPLFSTRMLQIIIGTALVLGTIAMLKSPPGIFSDSVSGFLVMRSMDHGAAFNHTLRVDPDLMTEDLSEFTSWWVPGQYLVPGAIHSLGFDLGESMMITTLFIWVLGLYGYLRLFQNLGFSPWVSWFSLTLIFCQPFILGYARFYHGGDLLQWGYLPWFTVWTLRSHQLQWTQLLKLTAAFCVGVFIKSSFLIFGSLVLGSLFLTLWQEQRFKVTRTTIGNAFKIGVVFLGAAWALATYTTMGDSPLGDRRVFHLSMEEILFALAAPLNSLFSLWTLYIPDIETIQWSLGEINLLLSLSAAAGLGWLILILRFLPGMESYKILVCVTYLGVISAFALAFSLDLLISFHVRHFRVAGLLLIPGTVALIGQARKKSIQWIFSAALLTACAASLLFFQFPHSRTPSQRPVGAAGFSHIYAGQDLLDALQELDSELQTGNNVFALPWPQLALDIQNNRTLNMRAEILTPQRIGSKSYYGEVDTLVVVLPAGLKEEGLHLSVLGSFKEHNDWTAIYPEVQDYILMRSQKRSPSQRVIPRLK
ncbi:MAG: hypothetical protein CL917_03410 [Deltaproteobacteria bacterium]|nr:hypothetical protein [Deltaproteobacteria bacterium]